MVFEPMSLEQQAIAIRESSRIAGKDLGLVILDSATSLYRVLLEAEDNRAIRRTLNLQLSELQEMARRHRIPVVITNQVYTDIESKTSGRWRQRPRAHVQGHNPSGEEGRGTAPGQAGQAPLCA